MLITQPRSYMRQNGLRLISLANLLDDDKLNNDIGQQR
jgi:hypothetical protein